MTVLTTCSTSLLLCLITSTATSLLNIISTSGMVALNRAGGTGKVEHCEHFLKWFAAVFVLWKRFFGSRYFEETK